MSETRVRFAPSPTGYLHVGGLRTALYNFLFAKKTGGKFILRIEDTDRNRFVEGAVENLIQTLKWCGLEYDEGPDKGKAGPYFQSQRLNIYKEHAMQLIEKGKAYYAFDTPERLQQLREEQSSRKEQPKYDKRDLSLTEEEIRAKLDAGEPYVIRLNVPENTTISFSDEIRGHVEFDSATVDDQILIKSDGYPTYHLANVVDDHLMNITHVIRGEEWLPSTPKHILLYDFFEWKKPLFAHLPLLLNPDKSKLSKRQGDVAVEDYKEKGYLKEALINFVALLGWNAGDDVEFYYLDEMIEKFSLERVNKAGAVFNVEKLSWLNGEHLRKKTPEEILPLLKNEMQKKNINPGSFGDQYLLLVIEAMKERIIFVKEILENSFYFFSPPEEYDEKVISKRWKDETPDELSIFIKSIKEIDNPSKEDFEKALRSSAENLNIGAGKLIHTIRVSVSGTGAGPGLFDILFILGKDEVIRRINKAIETVSKK
jgi:glutamyl-tRNA synthetase